jgi:hypothetical protein
MSRQALLGVVGVFAGGQARVGAQEATPAAVAEPPQPPSQAATGPGGAEFAYDGMLGQHYGPEPDGTSEPTGYWLFEPTRPRTGTPVPSGPVPLVIFLHGYTGTDPEIYHAWLDHIVRRGAIVVYPDWQPWDASKTNNDMAFPDALTAIKAALVELSKAIISNPISPASPSWVIRSGGCSGCSMRPEPKPKGSRCRALSCSPCPPAVTVRSGT